MNNVSQPDLSPTSSPSLTRKIMWRIGLGSSILIVLAGVAGYFYAHGMMEQYHISYMEATIRERVAREQDVFVLAEKNQAFMKKALLRRLELEPLPDPSQFEERYVTYPDGVIRQRQERADGSQLYVGRELTLTDRLRSRILIYDDLVHHYGESWGHHFTNTYIMTPENILLLHWPDVPGWTYDADPNLYIPEEIYFKVADTFNNPKRETVWSDLYYDRSGMWMISCETPLDLEGQHVATIGHDLLLGDLLNRTLDDQKGGVQTMIFREDGHLIVHPDYLDLLKARKGAMDIMESGDKNLKDIFRLALRMKGESGVLQLPEQDAYMAISRMDPPGWFFISIFPRKTVADQAGRIARMIVFFGFATLLFISLLLGRMLRKRVALPLGQLLERADAVARGRFDAPSPYLEQDEIGELFHRLALTGESFRNKQSRLTEELGELAEFEKRAEAEIKSLIKAKKLLETVLDHLPIRVFWKDLDSIFLGCNRLITRDAGLERNEELLGKSDYDMVWRSEADLYRKDDLRVMETGECKLNYEEYQTTPNGGIIWVQTSKVPMRNESGEIFGLVGTYEDITDRKVASDNLKDSERYNRHLFEQSPIGQALCGLGGELVDVNESFAGTIGRTVSETLALETAQLAPPERRQSEESFRRDVMKHGSCGPYETELLHQDGSRIAVQIYGMRVEQSGEMFIWFCVEDIRERLRARKALQQMQNQLNEIVNSMPSLMVGVGKLGAVTWMNQQAEHILQRSTAQVLGKPFDVVFPHLAGEMSALNKALDAGESSQYTRSLPIGPDGESFMEVTVFPLEHYEGVVWRAEDATEREQLKDLMVQSEKMLSLGSLAAGIAHEINNPLAGILQNMEVILQRITGDSEKNRKVAEACDLTMDQVGRYMEKRGIMSMLEAVVESGQRVAEVIQNMSGLSMEQNTSASHFDMETILNEAIDLASSEFDLVSRYDFRKIDIQRDYHPAPPVLCDGPKIKQVFLEILQNAARVMFLANPDRQGRIECGIRAFNGHVSINIRDNGPGMTETVKKRIFEPFFNNGSTTGGGMGLAVSYLIVVHRHGGVLSVDSEPGKGACFTIELPVAPKES